MDVPWPGDQCILCRTEFRLTAQGLPTEEHLIPESVGGILTCHFLCQICNSSFGQFEARLKEDPSIRLAIGNLSGQLPGLHETISSGQRFIAQSARGPATGIYKRGQFKIAISKQAENSVIYPTQDGRLYLERMLRKRDLDEPAIDAALRRLDEAPEDARVAVAEGFDIIKWTVTGVDPALDTRLLMVSFEGGEEVIQGAGITLLKIAFEYLALHLGLAIFDSCFDSIREALGRNDASLCPYRIEWKRGPQLAPFHGLIVEKKPDYLVVQIRLFGELVYRIHLPHLERAEAFRHCKYTHDLTNGEERWDEV